MSGLPGRLRAKSRELVAFLPPTTPHMTGSVPHLLNDAAEALEAAEEVVRQYHLWSEDANDGTYAYYRSEGLMMACVKLREALGTGGG